MTLEAFKKFVVSSDFPGLESYDFEANFRAMQRIAEMFGIPHEVLTVEDIDEMLKAALERDDYGLEDE